MPPQLKTKQDRGLTVAIEANLFFQIAFIMYFWSCLNKIKDGAPVDTYITLLPMTIVKRATRSKTNCWKVRERAVAELSFFSLQIVGPPPARLS